MSRIVDVLYPMPVRVHTARSIVRWWESRRLIYNGFVGIAGLITLTAISLLSHLPGGPPPLTPLDVLPGVVVYGIAANFCYSLGWSIELLARFVWGERAPKLGPFLFREGVFFSVGLTLLPLLIFGFASVVSMFLLLVP